MEDNNNQLKKSNDSYNAFAMTGFVLSIISFFLNFWGIVGILAVVFSILGLCQISKTSQKGKVLSILGIIFGAINIVYAAFILSIFL